MGEGKKSTLCNMFDIHYAGVLDESDFLYPEGIEQDSLKQTQKEVMQFGHPIRDENSLNDLQGVPACMTIYELDTSKLQFVVPTKNDGTIVGPFAIRNIEHTDYNSDSRDLQNDLPGIISQQNDICPVMAELNKKTLNDLRITDCRKMQGHEKYLSIIKGNFSSGPHRITLHYNVYYDRKTGDEPLRFSEGLEVDELLLFYSRLFDNRCINQETREDQFFQQKEGYDFKRDTNNIHIRLSIKKDSQSLETEYKRGIHMSFLRFDTKGRAKSYGISEASKSGVIDRILPFNNRDRNATDLAKQLFPRLTSRNQQVDYPATLKNLVQIMQTNKKYDPRGFETIIFR